MESIDKFIEEYAVMAKAHYLKRFELCKQTHKELESLGYKSWMIIGELQNRFGKFVTESRYQSLKRFEEEVDRMIERDKVSKKESLIHQVEKKIGKIVDAKGLSVGVDGSLNGLIVGENGKASVETIYAGGYNIQCLHYRILVKVQK